MTDYVIDVHGLTKEFGEKLAVDHISLQVKKGSIFGFLGSNGSGKTTTIRMICGLLTPTAGEGTCLGYDIIEQSSEIKMHIGYMPQKFSLYNGLTAYENLRFIAEVYQLKNEQQAIERIIADLELTPYRNVRAASLSGGWKQRLALACCLLHEPQLLFLDEPTAGVDPKARKDFWDYLHKISIENDTTILVTTHYMDEAEKCTDLAYINLGKLLYSGTTKALLPYSEVKTYILHCSRKEQAAIMADIKAEYTSVLASVINNDLRISSRNEQALKQIKQRFNASSIEETTPSFEEVFIGLMQ